MIKVMAPADRIAAWLPQQRWYGAKGVAIASAGLRDRVTLGGDSELWLVEVIPAGQPPSVYFMPVVGGGEGELDGAADEDLRRRLFELFRQSAVLEGEKGAFRFEPWLPLPASPHSRLLGAEQSNTSILYSDHERQPRWRLKLFRRVLDGENPECEIPRALVREVAVLDPPTAELHAALASLTDEEAFAPEPISPIETEAWRQRALAFLADPMLGGDAALLAPWRGRLAAGAPGLAALE